MTPIDEAEKKKAPRDLAADAYTYPNWPKKTDHDRPERYSTFMQYEIGYIVEEAFQEGWDASQSEAEMWEHKCGKLFDTLIEARKMQFKDFEDYYNEVSELVDDAIIAHESSLKPPPQAHDESGEG